MSKTKKHHPEVVTGSFDLHYEELVNRNRHMIIAVFAIGLVILAAVVPFAVFHSLAGGDFFGAEVETGTLSSTTLITKTTDTTASGNSYITFKLPACPSGQTGTFPNCTTTPPTCPAGTTGTPPNCTPIGGTTWKPLTPGTSWQWQISGTLNKTILDGISNPKKMFDLDMENSTAADIAALKAKGIVVICYLETGSWENYRSDAGNFPASILGKTMNGYPDEKYIDIRSQTVKDLIVKRLDVAKSKGCDGIEPDIDDSYQESTGFPITMTDNINYNKYIAAAAHARGMSMGLKNGPETAFINALVGSLDWALNEQCNQYSECGGYAAFINANKAVFQVEYSLTTSQFCTKDNNANFDGLKKAEALDATPRTACRNG
jgi:hypothetical protein